MRFYLPRLKILHRRLFGELILTFLAALFVITFFLSLVMLLNYVSKGMMIHHIARIVIYIIPSVLVMTIPISLLTASTLVYGRMSADNEINLLRTSGVHINFIVFPIVVISMLLALTNFYLNHDIIPYAKDQQKKAMFVKTQMKIDLLRELGRQHLRFPDMTILFEGLDENNHFFKPVIYEFSRENQRLEEVLVADRGEIKFDDKKGRGVFALRQGEGIKLASPDGIFATPDLYSFEHGTHQLDQDSPTIVSEISGMKTTRLRELEDDYLEEARSIHEKYPEMDPSEYPKRDREKFQRWFELKTELAERNAMAFTPIIFVLLGTPLGIFIRRQNKLVAFFVACMPVLLIYYPLYMFCRYMAIRSQLLPPVVSMWLPNIALGLVGAGLFMKLYRQ